MNIKKESLKVRQKDFKNAAKHVAGTYIEKGNFKKVMDLLKFLGKKVTVDKSDISKATYTFEQFRGKLDEKSVSKQQQKFMGMVRAVQKGEMDAPSPEVAQAAKTMKKKDVKDFAKTKHKGLPDKVKEATDQVNQDFPNTLESLDETTIKDIKDILTTIGSSKNMDQAVQMVMKKYKVPQGQAKAMVKKAIDSGVTYDKIKKKYAKESVELDEATRVSRKDFDKLKKGSMITIDYGSGIRGSTKRTFMVKGKSRSAKYNVDKVNMVDPNKPGGMKFHLYSRDGEDATLALGDMGATINSYSIKESIEEKRDAGKSATGYDIYHDTYSAAMQHAYAHAKKKHGVTVRPDEIDSKVASGPRKPSTGKTVSHILKTDKKQNLHVQVYNTGRKYELNMYVESVNEASKVPAGMKFIASYVYKDANGKDHTHTHLRKGKKMTDPVVVHIDGKEWKTFQSFTKAKQAAINHIKGMKESVELDEANAIDLARDVVKNKGAKKGLDMQTANAILTVYDKVNDANKKKMEKMPVAKLASAVWKILGKAK
jgi:hypothetical protein